MKKLVPFLFPVMALVVVSVVAVRWYNSQANHDGQISDAATDIQLEPITASDSAHLSRSAKDANTTELKGNSSAHGQVRSEVKDRKVIFSVNADLPVLPNGQKYQVWLISSASSKPQKAFVLEPAKGGYIGNGAISTSVLPITIEITLEEKPQIQPGSVILKGILPKN